MYFLSAQRSKSVSISIALIHVLNIAQESENKMYIKGSQETSCISKLFAYPKKRNNNGNKEKKFRLTKA